MDAGGTKNKTHCCASCFCGIRRLPIFPALRTWSLRVAAGAALCADGNSVRNSRISSPVERLPHTPLLTGSPVPSSCHRQRSQSSLPVLEQGPLAVSSTGCARAPCVSSQVIPYGYLDCIVARGGRQSTASTQKQHPFGCCFCVVSGGYLSFRAVSSQVLSAYKGLTSVFGMGTGGTP